MRMPFMLVFHQSKSIIAMKRIRFLYYFHVCILEFTYLFVPYHCDACWEPAGCVWEWRRYTQ